ncbi:MAG: hypothetical protein U5O39_10770 [Gammaproteobacteria bacterium]|nr:hypothetical protein [Gammaproteobacteria bacterium]
MLVATLDLGGEVTIEIVPGLTNAGLEWDCSGGTMAKSLRPEGVSRRQVRVRAMGGTQLSHRIVRWFAQPTNPGELEGDAGDGR